jgi:exosortase/archaeosortase
MEPISKVKIKKILKIFSKCLKTRKNYVIVLVILTVLYLIFSSYILWPLRKSVSTRAKSNSKLKSIAINEIIHFPIPNLSLMQRPLIIDTSRVKTISAQNLTNLISHQNLSKTLTTEVFKIPNNFPVLLNFLSF